MAMPIVKTGCELYEDCLTCSVPVSNCPLERRISMTATLKKTEAINLNQQGLDPEEIAVKLGRSTCQVRRYLAGISIKGLTKV